MNSYEPADLTLSTAFNGRLLLMQPTDGYRFSVDAPLLVWFACGDSRFIKRCADVGTGCGVIGLGLLAAGKAGHVTGIERQPRLARLAEENAGRNGLSSRFSVLESDIRRIAKDPKLQSSFDLVVSNPPFWPAHSDRTPDHPERRLACHEVDHTLPEWIRACLRLLSARRGRLCTVFPARRLDELIGALSAAGASATRMVLVFGRPDRPAELVLIEARPGKRGRVEALPPLFLKTGSGEDTPRARSVVSGEFSEVLSALPDQRGACESL